MSMYRMEYDDSENNRLEDALKESVKRYEELVSLIPVGVYILWIRDSSNRCHSDCSRK